MKKLILSALSLTFILSAAFVVTGCSKKDNHTHAFTQEIAEDKYLASEATCTEKARYYYSCNCSKAGKETFEYGEYVDHIYDESKRCKHCNCDYFSQDLKFTLSSSGTSYVVSGIGSCVDSDIVIPANYKGKPVISIVSEAFRDCCRLISVTIDNGVTTIGNRAFSECTGLTRIKLSDSVTTIGDFSFEHCIRLTDITIPNSVTSIGGNTFYNCTSLTSITIPDRVTSIREYTFYNCSSLTSITIPGSVTSIGESAFV